MTDLLKAAQADQLSAPEIPTWLIEADVSRVWGIAWESAIKHAIERQAVEQAKGVEAVGTICLTPVVFNHDANIFECVIQYELPHKPKQGDLLYITPPSVEQAKGVEAVLWWNGHSKICGQASKDWDARTGGILSFGCDIPLYTTPPSVEQAKGVEAVAWIEYEQFAINATPLEVVRGHTLSTCWHYQSERPVKRVEANFLLPLYTTPPSVDALIAEIDGLRHRSGSNCIYYDELSPILDNYRARSGG